MALASGEGVSAETRTELLRHQRNPRNQRLVF